MMNCKSELSLSSDPFTPGYQMHTQADITSYQENLGYAPEWELEEGIKDYISDIRKTYDEEVVNG